MSRSRDLRTSKDTLFPQPKSIVFFCLDCDWETDLRWDPLAVRKYDACPECGKSFDEDGAGIMTSTENRCRVCAREVVDARWNYCSERCRDIANAVARMFNWPSVRKRILDRDDHTCQLCGLDEDRWWRAYWQIEEMAVGHVGEDGTVLADECRIDPPAGGGYHVDHITPLEKGGHPFDESNLQRLCKFCHHDKTAKQNSTRDHAPEVTLEDYL